MLKELRPAAVLVLIFILLTGLVFPFAVFGAARILFPKQAAGSLIERGGKVIGSELIGQGFAKAEYFHPRPSAAGSGYDGANSGGTNLGATSDKLIHGVHKKTTDGKEDSGNFEGVADLAKAYRAENGLSSDAVLPVDAVTRSASGLDPHISIENALLQVSRVAKARNLSADVVRKSVENNIEGRTFGLLGEPRVNVLRLNLALDAGAK